ncbi:MAG: ATP-binding cassette domain-containing protein [Alcaligenaceae bacterium]|nr:ATP-binding cassette domain-containing protein [Alcaligenaceae bacterium]
MTKKAHAFDFSIKGITQNNLKNVDVSGRAGEVVVIAGVSGSGKSTLVNDVITAEALRQEAIRRKTDDLYVYAVRPSFLRSTALPECSAVSQRALTQTERSTFGTRTGLKGEIQKLFVEKGVIVYRGVTIKKPSLVEIRQFAQKFHADAQLYAVMWSYASVNPTDIQLRLAKYGIRSVFLRDERKGIFREVSTGRLPKSELSNYEISVAVNDCADDSTVLTLARAGIMLLGDNVELNFDEHYFYLPDGTLFRKPTPLLFSRSKASSLSGRCTVCDGAGKRTAVKFEQVINQSAPLYKGFLNVPLTRAGRYVAFKFLPAGLTALLKKRGVNVKATFKELSADDREIVIHVLTDKLLSNQSDENAKAYLIEADCSACEGSGYGYQTRAVLVGGKHIAHYLSLTASEFRAELPSLGLCDDEFAQLDKQLSVIEKLAIGHIGLNRATTTISSGEAQRLKLLDVLTSHHDGKIIVLDEPSANLQYQDNLAILTAILELKQQGNCVIVVEHNTLYRRIADRVLLVGPGAGAEGGYIDEHRDRTTPSMPEFFRWGDRMCGARTRTFETLALKPLRNVRLTSIKVPTGKVTAVIGASGSGKSTLVLDMIYSSLAESGVPVAKLDSKPPGKSPTSIVATYLEVFEDVRKVYAKAAAPYLTESDFSFNARGACPACGGSGLDENKVCGVCFGSRFRPDVALAKVEEVGIVELLGRNVNHIDISGVFAFLTDTQRIFNALSLTHITLGRSTSSLSGGELQRLKLAKFILNNQRTVRSEKATIILDEPSRGLDDSAVVRLREAMTEYLDGCSILVIEHNPALIYRCEYIIDLGSALHEKTCDTIVVGHLGEKRFPSLNHATVFDELAHIEQRQAWIVPQRNQPRHRVVDSKGKRYQLLPSLYIEQKNFDLERKFCSDFEVAVKDRNVHFLQSRTEVQDAMSSARTFLYNPFVTYLEKYPKVPASIHKTVIAGSKGRVILLDDDPWRTLVKAETFEEAFLKGGGVVATHQGVFPGSEKCQYYGIRLFSVTEKLIDGISPARFAFNLYRNACSHCGGYGHLKSYPFEKWIDRSFSPLDPNMTSFGLHRVMPKAAIAHFAKERLFDFSVAPSALTNDEYHILLYGFNAYRFRKPGKSGVVEDDFWEWRGLNSYIYRNASKLSVTEDLNAYLEWKKCPFCASGFKSTVTRYQCDGKSIASYLKG